MKNEVDHINIEHQKTVQQLNTTIEKLKDENVDLMDKLDSEKKFY